MLLSHYEILAWGTALWKLLDCVCSGPINTLAFGAWWSVQTTHVANEREREEGKLTGPCRQGSSLITIYRVIIPVYLFRKRLFLSFWMDDATISHHFKASGYSRHICFFSVIPVSSFITVATPSPLSWPGSLAHTTVNPVTVLLWTVLFSPPSFNIKLPNKEWSCALAELYNPACQTSCLASYRCAHHMWKHGCWNLSLTTRNTRLHISTFPKALWQWLPENLVSIITTMCARLNLNQRPRREKVFHIG